jgi:hypothetical protein
MHYSQLHCRNSNKCHTVSHHFARASHSQGETEVEVLRTTCHLANHGIGSILDYAAEDDVAAAAPASPSSSSSSNIGAVAANVAATSDRSNGSPDAGLLGVGDNGEGAMVVLAPSDVGPAAAVPLADTGGAVARQYAYAQ